MDNKAHEDVVLAQHPVLQMKADRYPVIHCRVLDRAAEVVWFGNHEMCELCGNELGRRTQVRIIWRAGNGELLFAYF